MELEAWRHLNPPPRRARKRQGWTRDRHWRALSQQLPNFVERSPCFLKRLQLQEPIEMFATVVIAPAHAKRRRQQAFLDVVADGPSRNAAEIGQFPDRVARFGHTPTIRQ